MMALVWDKLICKNKKRTKKVKTRFTEGFKFKKAVPKYAIQARANYDREEKLIKCINLKQISFDKPGKRITCPSL